jgi:hypothetical protein
MWGLWNARIADWFNPGGRVPHFRTREEAERLIPLAKRQYPFGRWEARRYRPEQASPNQEARPELTIA